MDVSVPDLQRSELTQVFRRALHSQTLELCDWEVQAITGGFERSSSIYKLTGFVYDKGVSEKWKLVLKILSSEPDCIDPDGFRYWRREPLAYQSGWFQHLPMFLTAPQCYAVDQHADGSIWVWLEQILAEPGFSWNLETFGRAAYALGLFNGTFLVENSLPSEPWMTRSWLSYYLEHAAPVIAFIQKNPDHQDIKAAFPGILLPLSLALYRERQRFLEALADLPQTFCHQDAFQRNLLPRGDHWVAVDWGYAGVAPVGSELAPLVAMALGLGVIPGNQAQELDRVCFSNYLQGLTQAGWKPIYEQVRLGFISTLLLRYVLGAVIGETLAYLVDEKKRNELILSETSREKSAENEAGINAYYTQALLESLRILGIRQTLRLARKTVRCGWELKLRFK